MGIHHLMVGTWTPPGAIFTFAFDDEALTLKLVRRTEIAHDEPISWMTFDVSQKDSRQADSKKEQGEQERESLASYVTREKLTFFFSCYSMRKKPSTALP